MLKIQPVLVSKRVRTFDMQRLHNFQVHGISEIWVRLQVLGIHLVFFIVGEVEVQKLESDEWLDWLSMVGTTRVYITITWAVLISWSVSIRVFVCRQCHWQSHHLQREWVKTLSLCRQPVLLTPSYCQGLTKNKGLSIKFRPLAERFLAIITSNSPYEEAKLGAAPDIFGV